MNRSISRFFVIEYFLGSLGIAVIIRKLEGGQAGEARLPPDRWHLPRQILKNHFLLLDPGWLCLDWIDLEDPLFTWPNFVFSKGLSKFHHAATGVIKLSGGKGKDRVFHKLENECLDYICD
jgi:hypothetical protein